MIAEYKGVRVERQNGLLKHVSRGHYDFRRKVILIRNGFEAKEEAKVLNHEYEHHAFGQRHRWVGKLCLNDNILLMSGMTALVWKAPLFLLVALPFLVHEIRTEARTTRDYRLIAVYSMMIFAILSASLAVLMTNQFKQQAI